MEPGLAGSVVVPGLVALAFLLVFAYLQRQSCERYFRSWQSFWFANVVYYALLAFSDAHTGAPLFRTMAHLAEICSVAALFVSARSFSRTESPSWSRNIVLGALGYWILLQAIPPLGSVLKNYLHGWLAVLVVLLMAAIEYARVAYQRDSTGLRWITGAILLRIVLLAGTVIPASVALGRFLRNVNTYLELLPLLLLGTAMVVVLFDKIGRAHV